MFLRKNVFFPKDNFDTFLRFHSNSWGGIKLTTASLHWERFFLTSNFSWKWFPPYQKRFSYAKIWWRLSIEKWIFWTKNYIFRSKKWNRHYKWWILMLFTHFLAFFLMKIRFLKHWENAAKNVDFLMILNFLHMVTLTSISTKKNENLKFFHQI